jgi:hypothetical protein
MVGPTRQTLIGTCEMLTLTTESELTSLYAGLVKESLYLEYKASDAVDKKSKEAGDGSGCFGIRQC